MKRANIRVIIAEMGGVTRFAEQAGVSANAVYGWIRDNSLPIDRAATLAADLGIDRDLLHDPWRGRERETLTPDETRAVFNRG
jgi:hypothetical protein